MKNKRLSIKKIAIHEIVWKKREELKDFFTVFEGDFILNILDNDDYVYIDEGIMINSGKFDGKKKYRNNERNYRICWRENDKDI